MGTLLERAMSEAIGIRKNSKFYIIHFVLYDMDLTYIFSLSSMTCLGNPSIAAPLNSAISQTALVYSGGNMGGCMAQGVGPPTWLCVRCPPLLTQYRVGIMMLAWACSHP